MKNVILLDIDGVLIITPPWKPDVLHADGYSDFDKKSVAHLNVLLAGANAELWLSSSRCMNKSLEEFNELFSNRGIKQELKGYVSGTDDYGRIARINAFLDHEPVKNFLILDDDASLDDLDAGRKKSWVKTFPLLGFDHERLEEALEKIKRWE
ncbi:MAG: hypothetical protein JWO44_1935 [Bacteroidetes bacterium]|nr:hypothetical protein [Bacteroidota bacterium]